MRDRAISAKFSTHRVSKQCNLCNFQNIFPSPKMAAILNFRIFAKNGKTQICFYLLNRARNRSKRFRRKFSPPQKMILNFRIFAKNCKTGFYLDRARKCKESLQFSKNFPLPKNGGHFEFSNFCQKLQNTNLLLSP